MRRTGVALEFLEHGVTQRPLGQHALDRMLQHSTRKALLQLAQGGCPDPARIATMAVVELALQLVAGDPDLFDIGHDNEIPGVDMRRIDRLMLAPQAVRDGAGKTSEHLIARVDDVPIALHILRFGGIGLHAEILRKARKKAGPRAKRSSGFNFAKSWIIIRHCSGCQTTAGAETSPPQCKKTRPRWPRKHSAKGGGWR